MMTHIIFGGDGGDDNHYNSKRRQEYKYTNEQSCEYNTLLLRQYIGGGKCHYNPKMESVAWEKFTKHDIDEMMETIIQDEIFKEEATTPVIGAIEQDLTDENDPNTYYLFLAFPTTLPSHDTATAAAATATDKCSMPGQYRRRIRVPLIQFCELLAKAFEAQMTSTTLCFVADASSGMGSDILSTIVKRCNHGVVSFMQRECVCVYLCTVADIISHAKLTLDTLCVYALGNHCRSILDDIPIYSPIKEDTPFHHH